MPPRSFFCMLGGKKEKSGTKVPDSWWTVQDSNL